jgi:hypothetical protein
MGVVDVSTFTLQNCITSISWACWIASILHAIESCALNSTSDKNKSIFYDFEM